jgi:hypothetical protein
MKIQISEELKNRLKNIKTNTNTKTYKTSDELFNNLEI